MKLTFEKCLLYSVIFFLLLFFGLQVCFASTYVPDNNLFENSYTDHLIDMASSQYDNFYNSKYVLFNIGYDYYLVVSDNATVNNNSITVNDSTLFKAIRTNSGSYNYYYDYSVTTENTTTINSSYLILSNIDFNKSINSSRFTDYQSKYYNKILLIFILGLCFAIFITKERKL